MPDLLSKFFKVESTSCNDTLFTGFLCDRIDTGYIIRDRFILFMVWEVVVVTTI
jgi:hypothetical protein